MTEIRTRHDGLSVAEAADTLGVHQNTVRQWIEKGLLPYTKIGLSIKRIRPEDLERFRGAPPEPPGAA